MGELLLGYEQDTSARVLAIVFLRHSYRLMQAYSLKRNDAQVSCNTSQPCCSSHFPLLSATGDCRRALGQASTGLPQSLTSRQCTAFHHHLLCDVRQDETWKFLVTVSNPSAHFRGLSCIMNLKAWQVLLLFCEKVHASSSGHVCRVWGVLNKEVPLRFCPGMDRSQANVEVRA